MKFSEINIGDIFESVNDGKFEVINKTSGKLAKILVRFLDTGYETKIKPFDCTTGQVKDRLKPSRFGVGFVGIGSYKLTEKGKITLAGSKWKSMLERCYCTKYQTRYPTYLGCSVDEEWHNFQNFAEWFYETYPKDGLYYELDKDSLVQGNKVYSKNTCTWLSKKDNISFSKKKEYSFFDPEGNLVLVSNLTDFCKDKDLVRELMGKVFNGKRNHHKGWTKAL